jgi:hypothetical protein
MANSIESEASSSHPTPEREWVKLGVVAAASALAGGLAAAWWYRKTLHRLRERDESSANPDYGMHEEE